MSRLFRYAAPHIRTARSTASVMRDVLLALVPPATAAVWFFGLRALWLLLTACLTSLLTEWLCRRLRHATHPFDGSALVSGVLLALSCPAGTPLWLMALLCVLAIAVFREAFGGIGCNLFNPAMAARACLLTLFPAFTVDYTLANAVSSATPLSGGTASLLSLTLGRVPGSLGETSVPMILLGAGYLLYRRVISWPCPAATLLGFAAVTLACGDNLLHEYLSGGLLFGTVYIFTDYTGRPATPVGSLLFACGCGALTAALRHFGAYPEGVCFAVLAMNLMAPALEQLTRPRVYGYSRKELSL